jgi:NAD+ synthetase
MPVIDVNKLIENRVQAIKEFHAELKIPRAQLDVSGGVDSAVMLGLLARAVGPDNITAVYSSIDSSKDSRIRALYTAEAFGVNLIDINVSDIFDILVNRCYQGINEAGFDKNLVSERIQNDLTVLGSLRSCIRAPIGRFMNRLMGNGIRHGTGNECEDRWLRFYQKGGDGEVDTNPMAMLSKGEVYQLGIGLGVPDSILKAIPSPDLQGVGEEGHNDEDELKTLTGVDWTYSKVVLHDVEHAGLKRGDYSQVGTIERMSRLLDKRDFENFLFRDKTSIDSGVNPKWDELEKLFPNNSISEIWNFLASCKKLERQTRHKENPNCPSLGNRKGLLEQGIITNELPKV